MPRRKAAANRRDRLGDLLQLQHHLIAHTSYYVQRLSDLAGQGAIEPREYIEEYFKLWSNCLDEIGDWWKPKREIEPREGLYPVSRIRYRMRAEKGDFRFEVPLEVFDRHREARYIHLSTDGLVRTFDPGKPLRQPVTLAPEQNVRVQPAKVTRTQRRPEYKIFGVSSIVSQAETYEGIVWGATGPREPRFPVSMIQLEVV